MPKQGVIFDFDGTLADTLPDIADAVNAGLATYDLPPASLDAVRGWIGDGLPELCRRAAHHRSGIPFDELAARVSAHYREHRLDKATLYEGIRDLLDTLADRSMPMAIVSNKPHRHMGPMTDSLMGQWSFVAVEGCREEDQRKPDPRLTLEVVSQMGLEPAQVWFVGDSAADIEAARNAKTIAVGVTWGYRDRDVLQTAGAAHLIDHPRQLIDLLDAR